MGVNCEKRFYCELGKVSIFLCIMKKSKISHTNCKKNICDIFTKIINFNTILVKVINSTVKAYF